MKLLITIFLISLNLYVSSQASSSILARVERNDKLGCIDTLGKEIIPIKYDDIGFWGNNLLPVNIAAKKKDYLRQGGKWGYCNNLGLIVIPLQFDKAEKFNEGIAAVRADNKWGFIDTAGNMIIQPEYDETRQFREGLCAVAKNNKWGFINRNGETVIPLEYGMANKFDSGLAVVYIGDNTYEESEEPDGYYCLINKNGKRLTTAKFESIDNFSEGFAIVGIAGATDPYDTKKGFINRNGEIVVPVVYDAAEKFSEGLAAVGIRNKIAETSPYEKEYTFGYIDTTGKEIIAKRFSGAYEFFNGRAIVRTGKSRSTAFYVTDKNDSLLNSEDWPKYGLIDKEGNIILDFNWRQLTPIDSNYFVAGKTKYSRDGIIDATGKTIIPFQYINLDYLGESLVIANDGYREKGEVRVFTLQNKLLFKTRKFAIPLPKYQYRLLHVRSHQYSKSGFVDINGNWVIKDNYDMVWDFESTMGKDW